MKYLKNDGEVFEGDYDVKVARHTASHILAQAVKRLYKDAKLAIGPAIDTGFYYDFDNLSLKQEDLEKIESEMKKIIKFFKGVKKEISRVRWPNKKEMIKYSIATLVFILFFALFFYGFDAAAAGLMELFK